MDEPCFIKNAPSFFNGDFMIFLSKKNKNKTRESHFVIKLHFYFEIKILDKVWKYLEMTKAPEQFCFPYVGFSLCWFELLNPLAMEGEIVHLFCVKSL